MLQRETQSPVEGRLAFGRLHLMLVAALVAATLVGTWFIAFGRPGADASGSGPLIQFKVYQGTTKTDLVCDIGAIGRKCPVTTPFQFHLEPFASVPPSAGYTAFRVVIQYTPNLTLKSVTKDCQISVEDDDPGLYTLACKLPQKAFGQRALANLLFNCDPAGGQAQIDLIGGIGTGSSNYVANPDHVTTPLKSVSKGSKLVADSLYINCNPPTATPTPSNTPTTTLTPTQSRTPTQTRTPTLTPTQTQTNVPGKADMDFRVWSQIPRDTLVCDVGLVGRKCETFAQGFSVDILAGPPPNAGFTAYKVVVQYSATLNLIQQPGFQENLITNCNLGQETKGVGTYTLACKMDSPQEPVKNTPMVNLRFQCKPGAVSGQIDLIGGAGAGVSTYVDAFTHGVVFLNAEAKGSLMVADSVLINCNQDFDGDGCPNIKELQPKANAATGGGRDPKDPWDFYDTNFDGIVDLANDIVGVIDHYGMSPADPDYDAAFDRGLSTGPNPWNMTAPDGIIDLAHDIVGVIQQYGHNCN